LIIFPSFIRFRRTGVGWFRPGRRPPRLSALTFAGQLVNCQHLAGQLAAVATSATVVIADLTRTSYCDLSGVRMLAGAYLDAMERGVQLWLVIPDGPVMRILALMDLDRWLQISPTFGAAIAEASAGPGSRGEAGWPFS
jgi:anti-anti-sigma factor